MYILIAGKKEGFDYKDGFISRHDTRAGIEETVKMLRLYDYKIFIISEVIDRIDDDISARTYAIQKGR